MASQRNVFVVNIEQNCDSQGLFDSMYAPLMNKLRNIPSLRVTTINSINIFQAKCVESNPKETVLLFTNEFVAKKKQLHEIVKQFAIGGGLIIFGCLFSSFLAKQKMDAFFETLGLPWKMTSYYRTTFGLTEFGRSLFNNLDVEGKYSAKAVQLANVLPEQKVYKPVENAATQSMVFAPEAADPDLVMSAFGKIGNGAIAYVGDVNAETGSDRLTAALCLASW